MFFGINSAIWLVHLMKLFALGHSDFSFPAIIFNSSGDVFQQITSAMSQITQKHWKMS